MKNQDPRTKIQTKSKLQVSNNALDSFFPLDSSLPNSIEDPWLASAALIPPAFQWKFAAARRLPPSGWMLELGASLDLGSRSLELRLPCTSTQPLAPTPLLP